ncbi:MAG: heavy-metal-associated domain-containing protein [Flavobacterium sp.]|jgi:copper chaperone|nr:heavy-metal-associated domain-containing protein [Flavobacterium sp.]
MENNTLKFKTNINCMGCVSKVTPELDKLSAIENWEVDIRNKDKVLTVEASSDKQDEIISAVEKAGFKIEKINSY